MLTDSIIKNTNGKEYKVLAQKGSYALLEKMNKGCQDYIVVYNLKRYEDCYVWGNGYYYTELEDAERFFDNK
ncbi:MAG: hypothetical protein AB7G87_09135 [Clostridia bacterium]